MEKQSILGSIMRVEHRLRTIQTSISFQQRRWNVDVKLFDSAKDKPFRVKFPRRTLPSGLEEDGGDRKDDVVAGSNGDEDGDVDVVFVRIVSLDSVLDGPEVVPDEEVPEVIQVSKTRGKRTANSGKVRLDKDGVNDRSDSVAGEDDNDNGMGIAIVETRSLSQEISGQEGVKNR